MDFKQKLKDLPDSPGVYIMSDADGVIIYIGKAKILRNRVRSYFSEGQKHEKVTALVSHVADFRYIICKSEIDALILEANLIKKHKPQYNILLKDDKHYPYIKLDQNQKYPKYEIVRKLKKDKCRYFGPYLGIPVRELEELLNEIFPLRKCDFNFDRPRKNHRPCLDYDLKRCLAPCAGKTTEEEYGSEVEKFIKFLSGNISYAEDFLTKKMNAAVEREDFEEAICYRDRFDILNKLRYKKVAALRSDVNFDVLSYASDDFYGAVSLLLIRNGKILGGENFGLGGIGDAAGALSAFITQYYRTHEVPQEIVVNTIISDAETISEWLKEERGKKAALSVPKKGARKELVDMAYINACDYLEKSKEQLKRKEDMTTGAIEKLKEALALGKLPRRIECYDISNISGVDKVASMTVFSGGEADKSSYRRFKIRTVEGADDFASMAEVLTRRFEKLRAGDEKFGARPDLIVLDGGKGQLSAGTEAAEAAGYGDIEMIALAEKYEHIYTRDSGDPVILDRNSVALKMLIRLRDEAHRFAVSYFRTLHGKNSLSSVLDNIDGVGKTLKAELVKHFRSVAKIKEAGVYELRQIPRMPQKTAEKIVQYFEEEKKND